MKKSLDSRLAALERAAREALIPPAGGQDEWINHLLTWWGWETWHTLFGRIADGTVDQRYRDVVDTWKRSGRMARYRTALLDWRWAGRQQGIWPVEYYGAPYSETLAEAWLHFQALAWKSERYLRLTAWLTRHGELPAEATDAARMEERADQLHQAGARDPAAGPWCVRPACYIPDVWPVVEEWLPEEIRRLFGELGGGCPEFYDPDWQPGEIRRLTPEQAQALPLYSAAG
jgi:hypothetical protein